MTRRSFLLLAWLPQTNPYAGMDDMSAWREAQRRWGAEAYLMIERRGWQRYRHLEVGRRENFFTGGTGRLKVGDSDRGSWTEVFTEADQNQKVAPPMGEE